MKNYFILIYYKRFLIMDFIKQFDNKIETGLKSISKITYVSAIAHFLLVLYAAKLAPTLPPAVLELFNNQYFRLFVFSMILWTANVTPSISILIALGFMVSINSANEQQLWEFLENTNTVSIDQGIEAVDALAQAAASSVPIAMSDIKPVADIAVSASQTTDGVQAIQALAGQAGQPTAATQEAIDVAKSIAVESIVSPTPSIAPIATIPFEQGVQAVQILAQGAVSPSPMDVNDVKQVADIAMSTATTNDGVQAIRALANQAMQPSAATPEATNVAANIAVDSIIPSSQMQAPSQAQMQAQMEQGVQAVQLLAQGAVSQSPMAVSDARQIADIAMSTVTTNGGAQAIQALANQAIQPSAATPEAIKTAANIAVESIIAPFEAQAPSLAPVLSQNQEQVAVRVPAPAPAPQDEELAGCYPMRRYDMSKVESSSGIQQGFETYQTLST